MGKGHSSNLDGARGSKPSALPALPEIRGGWTLRNNHKTCARLAGLRNAIRGLIMHSRTTCSDHLKGLFTKDGFCS